MTRDAFKYYIKQASKSLKKNKVTTVASVSTTAATLFILGALIAFLLNVSNALNTFTRGCQIQVFVEEGTEAEAYDAIGEKIKNISGVSNVEKYTKEQIFDEYSVKLEESAELVEELREDNPFRDSYKIEVRDLKEVKTITEELKKIGGIAKITNMAEAAGFLSKIIDWVRNISIWVIVIFCILTAFIVANAVKVSVHNRRKEINIMKYVGATDWFIRWPFVVEGIIIGFYAALVAILLTWGVYYLVGMNYKQIIPFANVWWLLGAVYMVAGVGIGAVGSAISIRKHLKV